MTIIKTGPYRKHVSNKLNVYYLTGIVSKGVRKLGRTQNPGFQYYHFSLQFKNMKNAHLFNKDVIGYKIKNQGRYLSNYR